MKTSNRLLLGLLLTIVAYVSAAFVELRVRGDNNSMAFNTESVAIPDFKYLVFENLEQRLYISTADQPMISARSHQTPKLDGINYEIQGDTLRIVSLGTSDKHVDFTVHASGRFTALLSISSSFQLDDVSMDSLTIDQRAGRGVLTKSSRFKHLKLNVTEGGEFDTFQTSVLSVELDMNEGDVEFRSPIRKLRGSMINNSYLSAGGVQDLAFEKDQSSTFRHYD